MAEEHTNWAHEPRWREDPYPVRDGDSLTGTSETAAVAVPPQGMGSTAAGTAAVDLSQAVVAEGDSLVPCGVHADGSLCFHGIDPGAEENTDGGRWLTCRENEQVLVESQPSDPEQGKDGWELTPTPCPSCGAADAVLVHPEPEGTSWPYFCPVCGDRGTGTPRQA